MPKIIPPGHELCSASFALPFCVDCFCYVRYCETIRKWYKFSFCRKLPGWGDYNFERHALFWGTNARPQEIGSVSDPNQLITLHPSSWPCTVSPEYAPTSLPFHAPNSAPKPKSSAQSESQPRTTRRPDHKATNPVKLPPATGQSHHRYQSRGYNLNG